MRPVALFQSFQFFSLENEDRNLGYGTCSNIKISFSFFYAIFSNEFILLIGEDRGMLKKKALSFNLSILHTHSEIYNLHNGLELHVFQKQYIVQGITKQNQYRTAP